MQCGRYTKSKAPETKKKTPLQWWVNAHLSTLFRVLIDATSVGPATVATNSAIIHRHTLSDVREHVQRLTHS